VRVEGLQHVGRRRGSRRPTARAPAPRAGLGANRGDGPAQGLHRADVPRPDERVPEAHRNGPHAGTPERRERHPRIGGGLPILVGTRSWGVASSGSSQESDEAAPRPGWPRRDQLK
jgi:hypothetical protein